MIIKTCPQCNKSFVAQYRDSKFCSKVCASLSMSHKVPLKCPVCSKVVYLPQDRKYCSRACTDAARRGTRLVPIVYAVCPVCNKSFEVNYAGKRFCSRKCANIGKIQPSTHTLSEEGRKSLSKHSKMRWQNAEFRQSAVDRMTNNNPVYMPGVVEKASATRLENNSLHNNFKYGNGHISPYEQAVKDKLEPLGFVYNYAIVTKPARDAYPEAHYANAYKPDFVNLNNKLCIEVDGYGHSTSKERAIDAKKEDCLKFLGYTVIRFTHEDISKGVFDKWLNSYLKNM